MSTQTLSQPVGRSSKERSLCPRPRKRPDRHGCCFTSDTPVERPDPAIYSQPQLLSLGEQPSWNSPDITSNHWAPFRLMAEAGVIIRNLSATASAIGVRANAAVSRFGIGYPRTPIVSVATNLAPSAEQTLLIPFPQWVMSGEQRIGFHVTLEHSADKDASNNYGAQTHEGFYTSEAGRLIATTLPVRNPLATSQLIQIAILGGTPDLTVSLVSPATAFAPFEERILPVQITVAASLTGGGGVEHTREATIMGQNQDGSVIDGVTYVVRIDS
jgi:hypothetical protein